MGGNTERNDEQTNILKLSDEEKVRNLYPLTFFVQDELGFTIAVMESNFDGKFWIFEHATTLEEGWAEIWQSINQSMIEKLGS